MVKEKTIRELVNRVARESGHLLDMNDDAVVIYQDLIGHASVEENRELANDQALNETFYRIYGVAYGTTAAIKFYLNNSDKIADMQCQMEEYKAAFDDKCKELKDTKEKLEIQTENAKTLNNQLYECKRDMDGTVQALEMVRRENMELKAKLYDLTAK